MRTIWGRDPYLCPILKLFFITGTMKLRNEIFTNDFLKALGDLLEAKLTVTTAFKLRKLVKEIESNHKVYEESRQALLNEHAKKDKDGERIVKGDQVQLEDAKAFNVALQELLEVEVEYDCEKVTLPDHIEISAQTLIMVEDILNITE